MSNFSYVHETKIKERIVPYMAHKDMDKVDMVVSLCMGWEMKQLCFFSFPFSPFLTVCVLTQEAGMPCVPGNTLDAAKTVRG